MDVSAIVRDIKTGRATLVCFPVEMSELKLALGLREEDDLEYIIADSDCQLLKEHDSIEMINQFVELVENVDSELVKAVHQVIGYTASDFVDYDFNFGDCCLLSDVTTRRELGEYYFDELGVQGVGKEALEMYFDHEAYGRDIDLESQGGFSDYGYVEISG